MQKITLIPGDGTGPELITATRRCIDALDTGIEWIVKQAGEEQIKKFGTPLPEETIDSIKKTKIALKGPITTPVGKGFRSINVEIRKKFDLYANLRPAKSYPGVRSKYQDIDLIVVRENTEDLYAGIEFEKGSKDVKDVIEFLNKKQNQKIRDDSGISIKPISVFGSERIVRFAFDYAKKNKRKKVTAVHKANIMKFTDGLFLDTARKVAEKYKGIEFEDRIVDNMCMQLVQKPELYDVLVMPNLYGDILSDLCAGLVGGLGVAPGANIGDNYAMFEPVHGSAPKYKGMNKVNPTATILAGVLMLRHLGKQKEADILEKATAKIIKEGKYVTYDINPTKNVGTKEMADAIIKEIEKA